MFSACTNYEDSMYFEKLKYFLLFNKNQVTTHSDSTLTSDIMPYLISAFTILSDSVSSDVLKTLLL